MPGDFRQQYRYDHTLPPGDAEQAFAAVDGGGNEVVIKLVAARDPGRFLQEMQAAAAISHPNVIRVLDWGTDASRCYVVTEHVRGTRLEALLTAGPLQYSAVLDAGEQAAAGLSAIHAHGLVHGGVTPANLIHTSGGVLKLMDLGIRTAAGPQRLDPARPSPAAAYISPQEAAGYEPTQASDQYSLGAVLFELCTGRPPVLAPVPVGVAVPAGQSPPPLRTLAPDVPPMLEAVITRALAQRPEDRYGSVEEMRRDLERARLELLPARSVETMAVTSAVNSTPVERQASYTWAWITGIIVLLAIIAVLAAWALGAFSGSRATPDVVGQTLTNAKATLANAGLKLGTVQYANGTGAQTQGLTVTRQSPAAGTNVDKGTSVNVTLGTGTTAVPNVIGLTQSQASSALQKAGLSIGTVEASPSTTVVQGQVVSQSPAAGTSVRKGSQVTLVVSSGTGSVTVPNVVGSPLDSATVRLENAGFTVTVAEQSSSAIPVGSVISQNPSAGVQAQKGSAVTVVVSTGAASPTASPSP